MQAVGLRYITVIYIILFPVFSVKGQSEYWQTLEEKWKHASPNSTEKLKIGIELSQELSDEQIELATFYAQETLKIIDKNKDASDASRGELYLILAEIYARKRNDKDANFYLKRARKLVDTTTSKYVFRKAFMEGIFVSPLIASKTLEHHLKKSPPEELYLGFVYLEYATNQLRQKNYEKAIENIEKAEKIFEKLNKIKYLARCYNNKGLTYKNMYFYSLGIENYIKAVKLYRSINSQSRNLSITYLNLGNIYIVRPQDTFYYKSARNAYIKSLEIAENIKDSTQIISSYERLGSLSLLSKDTKMATEYYSKGFHMAQKINSVHYQNFLKTRLAKAYDDNQNSQKAKALLQEVLDNTRHKGDVGMFMDAVSTMALVHQSLGEHQDAINILEEGIEVASKNDLKLFLMGFYNRQASNYIKLKEFEKALQCLKNIENLKDLTDKNVVLSLYQNYRIIDSARGDYLGALTWTNKYLKLSDSLAYTERMRGFTELQQKFELEEKELENQLLKSQNEQEMLSNKRNKNYIIVLSLAFCGVASLGSILWIKQKKLKEKTRQTILQENDLRNFSEKLSTVNQELIKKHEFDNTLLTIISHDLKGPIQSVKTLLEMMQRGAFKTENQENLLDMATTSLNSSSSLLENLLFWAKSYQNDFHMKNKEIALRQLCERSIELLALQAEQKSIMLENLVDDEAICYADEDILSLIIRNLIANAIKFTMYGKVSVETETREGFCQITITDTGIGIAPENIDKIFTRNYYTKGTHKEKGTGLGLMLCKEFIERNHGTLSVKSELGKGSSFIIKLPLLNGQVKKLQEYSLK